MSSVAWSRAEPADRAADPRTARAGEVLHLIRTGEARTISELAAVMGLARSTVTDRVDLLIARGLVEPRVATANGRGRPAAIFEFAPSAGVALVAQVGMSGLRVGIADLSGAILATATSELAVAEGPLVLFDLLRRDFASALADAGRSEADVVGVGVGLPGRIELETTRGVAGESARSWTAHPLLEWLEETYAVPVRVDRGVTLLASAEHRSFHPDASVLLGVKVGTVIECGVVVEGRPLGGGSGIAGEIGHTVVGVRADDADRPCVCGNTGCLNAVASGAALVRDLAGRGRDVVSARDVAHLAAQGDEEVTRAVREAGRRTGEVLAGAVNLLNPDVIVVWGYLADGGDHLVAGLREGLYRAAVPAASRHVRIETARFGDEAALRGAASAVIEEALEPSRVDALLPREA